MSYADRLRKKEQENLDRLSERIEEYENSKSNFKDEDDRYWMPTVDKTGNGYAVIRFLPAPEGEEDAFVRLWSHAFQGPGGWYINNSLSTIGKSDPVGEMNAKLWKQGENSAGRKMVTGTPQQGGTKRKLHYISNIYVVDDPAKPEYNGKVCLFKYGKKIFDKIKSAAHPTRPDIEKFNAFSPLSGANFKLIVSREDGYRSYNQSEWDLVERDGRKYARGPLFKDDAKLNAVLEQLHSLQDEIGPDKFKTYNELKERLLIVMGETTDEDDEDRELLLERVRPVDEAIRSPWDEQATAEDHIVDPEDRAFFDKVRNLPHR